MITSLRQKREQRLWLLKTPSIQAIFILVFAISHVPAAVAKDGEVTPYVAKRVVILGSFPNYRDAEKQAVSAADKLVLLFDRRELTPDATVGLTFPEKTCTTNGYSHPCYIARQGDYEQKPFISVEHSSAYSDFKKGYYLVVLAVRGDTDPDLQEIVKQAKTFTPDAYAKRTPIYVGCAH